MSQANTRVAVIGCGYWGRNLVRNFHELGSLSAICDVNSSVAKELASQYGVKSCSTLDEILALTDIHAIVIAAPAAQHYHIAKRAMVAGKDVFVEKPLALRLDEGEELVDLASRLHRIIMVGHLLQYHPAILELRRLLQAGELGRVNYVYSSRLNFGKLRTEENILWSFAPHDISAILFLLNETPKRIATHGGSYLNQRLADTTLTTCEFQSGVMAHIFVSWLHPFKEQKLAIIGGRRMAVFDDTDPERKLVLYSHRIDWIDRAPVAQKDAGQVVKLPAHEPLRLECEHFLDCLTTRRRPRTDAESGVRVLQVLEACEESLLAQGKPIELTPTSRSAPRY